MSPGAEQHLENDLPSLDGLLQDVQSLEGLVADWDDSQRNTYQALREAHDALAKEAFARLIRSLKSDPGAMALLKDAVKDEVVYAVLRHHGLIRPSIQERLEEALDSVRPFLASHGGNVEIVNIEPPDTVEIRLLGACDGCPASSLTLQEGVEKAIRGYCPEISTIRKTRSRFNNTKNDGAVRVDFVSPFARREDPGWAPACEVDELSETSLKTVSVGGNDLILYCTDGKISCYQNACAHMGMPLDTGTLSKGILTCPHHGFQFLLATGECLTAPEVQLHSHGVRINNQTVEVKLL